METTTLFLHSHSIGLHAFSLKSHNDSSKCKWHNTVWGQTQLILEDHTT